MREHKELQRIEEVSNKIEGLEKARLTNNTEVKGSVIEEQLKKVGALGHRQASRGSTRVVLFIFLCYVMLCRAVFCHVVVVLWCCGVVLWYCGVVMWCRGVVGVAFLRLPLRLL